MAQNYAEAVRIPHASGDEPEIIAGEKEKIKSIPHASGDEPQMGESRRAIENVYPTRVGMNRIS